MPSLPGATRSGVFVSYSRKDGEAFARNLRAEIEGRNIPDWYDLEQQQDKFYNDLNTRCQVRRVSFMAPDLPAGFVPRDIQFNQLKASLLSPDKEEPVAIAAALRGANPFTHMGVSACTRCSSFF